MLKEIIIEIVVQSKQFQEACTTKIQTPFTRSSIKDKKIKDLEDNKKQTAKKNKITKKYKKN